MKKNATITIVGGGNIGTQFACVCASKGFKVNILSSKPSMYDGILEIIDEDDNITCQGVINSVSDSIEDVMENTEIIIDTHPAYMFAQDAEMILPYIKPGMCIVAIPGTGGAEFTFKKCIDKGATLCGLQRVPAVARLKKYGKSVRVEGKREELFLAAIPNSKTNELSELISMIFDMPCHALPNYLCVTMTPSNPILHTTRLATLFEDYTKDVVYPRNPLFYGEWSNESSKRLIECDSEHQSMLKKIVGMDLTSVKSLVLHYDNSDTPEKMTKKLSSIKSLYNLQSPMKKVNGGFIPDFSSRYFTADFPYGLAIIEEIAELTNTSVPMIKKTMEWYRNTTGDRNRLELKQYGLNTIEDIYSYYEQ